MSRGLAGRQGRPFPEWRLTSGPTDRLLRVRLLRDAVKGVEIQRISRLRGAEQRILRAAGACPPSPLVSVRTGKRGKRRKSKRSQRHVATGSGTSLLALPP